MQQLIGVAGLTALVMIAGVSFVIQQAVNSGLRASLGSAAWAGFVSYVGGTVCMLALACILRETPPAATAIARSNWWEWSGGLFGAIYIAISILVVPRLGTAAFVGFLVAGQMLASLIVDQYGLLGIPEHAVSLPRLVGAALLIGGVILIRS